MFLGVASLGCHLCLFLMLIPTFVHSLDVGFQIEQTIYKIDPPIEGDGRKIVRDLLLTWRTQLSDPLDSHRYVALVERELAAWDTLQWQAVTVAVNASVARKRTGELFRQGIEAYPDDAIIAELEPVYLSIHEAALSSIRKWFVGAEKVLIDGRPCGYQVPRRLLKVCDDIYRVPITWLPLADSGYDAWRNDQKATFIAYWMRRFITLSLEVFAEVSMQERRAKCWSVTGVGRRVELYHQVEVSKIRENLLRIDFSQYPFVWDGRNGFEIFAHEIELLLLDDERPLESLLKLTDSFRSDQSKILDINLSNDGPEWLK